VLFAVGGEADPANGPPPPVISDARWGQAADAALKLKMVTTKFEPARAEADWKAYVKQLSDLADASLKAARAKDGAALSSAANALADNCSACHAKYKPQTPG
jgi:cytochrome c556